MVPLWDGKRTKPPGEARNLGTGQPRVQKTFDALASEVGFGRALIARDLGELGHHVIVQRDRQVRHAHIIAQNGFRS